MAQAGWRAAHRRAGAFAIDTANNSGSVCEAGLANHNRPLRRKLQQSLREQMNWTAKLYMRSPFARGTSRSANVGDFIAKLCSYFLQLDWNGQLCGEHGQTESGKPSLCQRHTRLDTGWRCGTTQLPWQI